MSKSKKPAVPAPKAHSGRVTGIIMGNGSGFMQFSVESKKAGDAVFVIAPGEALRAQAMSSLVTSAFFSKRKVKVRAEKASDGSQVAVEIGVGESLVPPKAAKAKPVKAPPPQPAAPTAPAGEAA